MKPPPGFPAGPWTASEPWPPSSAASGEPREALAPTRTYGVLLPQAAWILLGSPRILASPPAGSLPGGTAGEAPVDFPTLGLLLALAGSFLLANSILFRPPRSMVARFFGESDRRLTSIRTYIFHRLQVHLGFLFLLAGFGFQLVGRFRPRPPEDAPFPVHWVGLLLLVVAVCEICGWWLSHLLFRRTVRAYFRDHPPDLEGDFALARELGELFGVPPQGDDSVPSYLLRIRHRVGLSPHPGGPIRMRRGEGSEVRAEGRGAQSWLPVAGEKRREAERGVDPRD